MRRRPPPEIDAGGRFVHVSAGRALLEAYLEALGTVNEAARSLARAAGCSRTTILELANGRARHPSLPLAVALERVTGGMVTCGSWVEEEKIVGQPTDRSAVQAPIIKAAS